MREALIGLVLGLLAGGFNQWVLWRFTWRVKEGKIAALMVGYIGGCATRITMDAAALYVAWLLTRSHYGLLAAAAGLLLAMGLFTAWVYSNGHTRRGTRKR